MSYSSQQNYHIKSNNEVVLSTENTVNGNGYIKMQLINFNLNEKLTARQSDKHNNLNTQNQ